MQLRVENLWQLIYSFLKSSSSLGCSRNYTPFMWNLKFHHSFFLYPAIGPYLESFKWFYTLTPCCFKIHFNIVPLPKPAYVLQVIFLCLCLSDYKFISIDICPCVLLVWIMLILLDLIAIILVHERCTLWNCSLCRFASSSLTKLNSVAVVRKRTIPTERPPLVGEVSANLCG
jgi:hypothetical protein